MSEGVFHLSLCLFTFAGRSADLAYLVHKSGHKTATFFLPLLTDVYCSVLTKGDISYYGTIEPLYIFTCVHGFITGHGARRWNFGTRVYHTLLFFLLLY